MFLVGMAGAAIFHPLLRLLSLPLALRPEA